MINLTDAILISAAAAVIHMSLYWLLSLIKRDTSIVDIAWGLNFVLVVWVLRSTLDEIGFGYQLLTLVVTIWGVRLAYHIYRRKGPQEDWRYGKWRERYGRQWWWVSYFQTFLLQAVLALIIAAPIIYGASQADSFDGGLLLWLGAAVWAYGFYYEAVGDHQLNKFIAKKKARKNPKRGKQIMTEGLWRKTRHPNYFGEVTQWWGIYVMSLSLGAAAWWLIISPITISLLILRVSGITMLEKKYEGNREFERYKKKTNAFFPW